MSLTRLLILGAAAWAGFMVYRTEVLVSPILPRTEEEAATNEKPSLLSFLTREVTGGEASYAENTHDSYRSSGGGGIGGVGNQLKFGGGSNKGGIGGVGPNRSDRQYSYSASEKHPKTSVSLEFLEAAAKGDMDGLHEFLSKQASIDARDGEKRTALMYASWNGQNEAASFLLAKGASVSVKDGHGHTALDYAAGRGLSETVQFLLKRAAKPDDGRYGEYAALMQTVMTGDITKLPAGNSTLPTVNRINPEDQAPLFIAAGNNSTPLMEALIKRGANVNLTNSQRQAALHWAAWNDKPEAASLLLQKGAKLDAKDNNGNTPLIMAAENNSAKVVALLLQSGADKYAANNDGQTAYFIAKSKQHHDLLDQLK